VNCIVVVTYITFVLFHIVALLQRGTKLLAFEYMEKHMVLVLIHISNIGTSEYSDYFINTVTHEGYCLVGCNTV
jgi:hypothetical protein